MCTVTSLFGVQSRNIVYLYNCTIIIQKMTILTCNSDFYIHSSLYTYNTVQYFTLHICTNATWFGKKIVKKKGRSPNGNGEPPPLYKKRPNLRLGKNYDHLVCGFCSQQKYRIFYLLVVLIKTKSKALMNIRPKINRSNDIDDFVFRQLCTFRLYL